MDLGRLRGTGGGRGRRGCVPEGGDLGAAQSASRRSTGSAGSVVLSWPGRLLRGAAARAVSRRPGGRGSGSGGPAAARRGLRPWGKVQAWLGTQEAAPAARRLSATGSSGHIRSSVRRCSRSSVPEGSGWRTGKKTSSRTSWGVSDLDTAHRNRGGRRARHFPRKNSRSLPHTRATPTITCPSRGGACTGCSESGYHSRPSTTPGGTSFGAEEAREFFHRMVADPRPARGESPPNALHPVASEADDAPCDVSRHRDVPGTEDGPPRSLQPRSSTRRNGGHRRPAGAGQPTWLRRRARQGFRPRGRDMAAAPESDSGPPLPRSWSWWWCPSQSRIPLSMTSRPCPESGPWPGRRRAGGAPLKP